MKTVLCICTYRRPAGLRKLLETLPQLAGTDGLEVVVSDNDPGAEGLAVCEALSAAGYPFPLHTVSATEPGISAARNAACTRALQLEPRLLAFLDDDEWPEPQWLTELQRVRNACNVDVVGGPTRPVFPEGCAESSRQNAYYGADLALPDQSLCQLQAGGNFLITSDALQALAPEFFNHAFAHSGGEDLAFFMQLRQRGYSMAWAAHAIVHEPVPEDRLHDAWVQQRIVNIHNSRVRVMQLLQPGVGHSLVRGLKTIALGGQTLLASALSWLSPSWMERSRQLRWKLRGKVSAHLGHATIRNENY
ncbi:glycosyltransferase family 2 protein [Granulosicoccus sp. 3-233]|uniref:glycosyltransferase family 2 protein n=1 Tax=Granulosicoccus sp. 3-233 TaxID=3417969 RepID=UPI003D32BCA9